MQSAIYNISYSAYITVPKVWFRNAEMVNIDVCIVVSQCDFNRSWHIVVDIVLKLIQLLVVILVRIDGN